MYPKIEIVPVLKDNYSYLIRDRLNVAIVDPGEAEPIRARLVGEGLVPVEIWLTHKHSDHIDGAAELARRYDIPIKGPEEIPRLHARFIAVGNGEVFRFGPLTITAREIRGHTQGHLLYFFDGAVITGDVLFIGGCGRIFDGTSVELYSGIRAHLQNLPAHTRVYCGHEYAEKNLRFALSLEPDNAVIQKQYERVKKLRAKNQLSVPGEIGIERSTNPFLRVESESLREALKRRVGNVPRDPAEVFALLRRLRNEF